MKIYLAARYSKREGMLAFARELTTLGHEVTSRWIYGDHEGDDDNLTQAAQFAAEDLNDLCVADCLIHFCDDVRVLTRGGNFVEFGYALAAEKLIVVVGKRSNVFHCLPQVNYFEDVTHCLQAFTPSIRREVAA
jgi:nucleoside 2-deoxyribosyltransferase